MGYYIGLAIVIVILAMFAVIFVAYLAERRERYLNNRRAARRSASVPGRRGDSRASSARGFAVLAAIGILICFWIVGIWIPDPVLGELHENVKVKIFWTGVSVFVLVIIVAAFVEEWGRR
jgi:hypothetical protein